MNSKVIALVELFRRLAGRLPDHHLAGLRRELTHGRLDRLEWTVLSRLRDNHIRLAEREIALLPMIGLQADDFAAELSETTRPAYRFEPCDASAGDRPLLAAAESIPTLCRVAKARRIPANACSLKPEKIIYVPEVASGEDLPELQAGLSRFTGPEALLEVVVENEDIPPYQAAARAAGRQIWPGRGGQLSSVPATCRQRPVAAAVCDSTSTLM